MKEQKKFLFIGIALIVLVVGTRLVDLPENFTASLAVLLFAGAYFRDLKLQLGLPLVALLISDLILGFDVIHFFVYASYVLIGLFAITSLRRWNFVRVAGVSLFSSLFFFFTTNFGVWLVSGMYAKSLEGLISCYALALPFYRNSFLADTGLTLCVFAVAHLVSKWTLVNKSLVFKAN